MATQPDLGSDVFSSPSSTPPLSERRRPLLSTMNETVVDVEDQKMPGPSSLVSRRTMRLSKKTLGILLVFVLVAPLLMAFSSFRRPPPIPKPHREAPADKVAYPKLENLEKGNRRFVIIIPADSPGPDLCKAIASAIALGYPSPIIVNWGQDFQKTKLGYGSSHLGKVTGTLDYLDAVTQMDANKGDKLEDDDLVLVIDAYDIWFQLPPKVLLRRYHDSNRKANIRLLDQWSSDPKKMPMQQTIIISSQKRCYPTLTAGSDQHCDMMPESPLRDDLYGSSTDKRPLFGSHKFHSFRPRYVNSGSIMGPAADMKKYFRRVKHKMEQGLADGIELYSDQGIFGEILGEQEIWRAWRRSMQNSTESDLFTGEGAALIRASMEYHVGLDYYQDLFLPTVYEENDGMFLRLNNKTLIEAQSKALGVPDVRLEGVPEDTKDVYNPLADVVGEKEQTTLDWGEMPLYADFYTTAVPALLHHNAHRDGLKERRVWWWNDTWYFPYLRDLLAFHLKPGQLRALGNIPAEGGGDVIYWAPKSDETKRKPRLFEADKATTGFSEMKFGTVCKNTNMTEEAAKHWYDEVFRDGLGPI